ncbi:diaminobutyrate acetyltransferase [Georgenia alba]|uniref:L-2,4-diaminobutyric acid acetyltransferase n=1 Tax=Georgenia alba TaxID=2233858 RepID=A0ABW2Q4K2_9MICO
MPMTTQDDTDDPPHAATTPDLTIRPTTRADGAAMWRLARDGGVLDLNSSYAYLLYAQDFADTCRVATLDGSVVGFVLAHRPPARPGSLFVWQVGVSPEARGRRIAARMIEDLLDSLDVETLEATVTESNTASRALFSGIAARRGAELTWREFVRGGDFPDEGHEAEPLLQIPVGH